jgi:hypothetical protein
MRVLTALLGLVMVGLPAIGLSQETFQRGPQSQSVIRTAGHWDNYMHVPDGHCGCPMPVRCNDYTECCRPCGIRPICFLKRVGRMLDCLLPCNKCRGGGCLIGDCHGCGWYKARCPKNCSYCEHSGGHGLGCSSCTSGVPAMGDPFIDDPPLPMPMPPTPAPDMERGASRSPWDRPYNIKRDSRPHHAAAMRHAPSVQSAPVVRPQNAKSKQRPAKVATARPHLAPPAKTPKAADHSVLRRTAYEDAGFAEPAPLHLQAADVLPIDAQPAAELQQPVTASNSDYWADVPLPRNPLR